MPARWASCLLLSPSLGRHRSAHGQIAAHKRILRGAGGSGQGEEEREDHIESIVLPGLLEAASQAKEALGERASVITQTLGSSFNTLLREDH